MWHFQSFLIIDAAYCDWSKIKAMIIVQPYKNDTAQNKIGRLNKLNFFFFYKKKWKILYTALPALRLSISAVHFLLSY